MKDCFFKFPSTPHLATLPGIHVRGDKVLTLHERDRFLQNNLLIEEKIDGANLGISFTAAGDIQVQNRGSYLALPEPGQWKSLQDWLAPRIDSLFEHLTDQYILFGEWCYARHSIFYDRLPDWFLGFDLCDKRTGRFLASEHRNRLLRAMHIVQVPQLASGKFTFAETIDLLSTSKFSDELAEGLYLRYDDEHWLVKRAKLVRPDFIQAVEAHWSRSAIVPNRLRPDLHS